jgi:hypothetical protein
MSVVSLPMLASEPEPEPEPSAPMPLPALLLPLLSPHAPSVRAPPTIRAARINEGFFM